MAIPSQPVHYPSVVFDGGSHMYVVNDKANTVTKINIADGQVVASIPVGTPVPSVRCDNCGAPSQIKNAECLFCHTRV
jgi:YVTN family beta-propeller protein